MNIKEIKDLIKLLDGTEITELDVASEGNRVVIKKGHSSPTQFIQSLPAVSAPAQAASVAAPASTTAEEKNEPALKPNQVMIVAPMVGTFYRAPSPEAAPYVEAGQVIEAGQVVCIIEAMKLMNEIESENRGKIVQILAENAQPVEFGQPLFIIEKT